MVSMVGSNSLPFSSFMTAGAGRVGVPVEKSQALYAQFEHVYGVPTEGGVRLDRIKILNTLIDELSSIKHDRSPGAANAANFKAQSPERLDALIEKYQKEIKTAASAPTGPYRPRPALPQAVAVDILV